MLPKLQVALDNTSYEDALASVSQYGEYIDVIEVGTILCVAEGMVPVRKLRALYPNKIILADIKGADAGNILAKQCFDAGANWMTVICCADVATMVGMKKVADSLDNNDVQIELYGDWTMEQAKEWRSAGMEQVVYHRSRDAQAAGKGWEQSDLDKIGALVDLGFKVTITGGLNVEDLDFFKDYPIYCVIAGRGIRDAANPAQAAQDFKAEIARIWG